MKMHRRIFLAAPLIFSLSILLGACSAPQPSPSQSNLSQSNPDVQVTETQSRTITSIETIHINNCGGKADSKQVAERSFSVNIEGAIGASVGYLVVQGSVSAKYGQYRNVSKRQEFSAPPGTNMEITLKWTEQEWVGALLSGNQSGTYDARAPLSLEQVSSRDLGCGASLQPPISAPQPTTQSVAPVQPPTQVPYDCSSLVSTSRPVTPMGTGDTCWLKLYDGSPTEVTFNDAGQITFMSLTGGNDVFFFVAKKGDRLTNIIGATIRPMRFITVSYGNLDGAKQMEIRYHTETVRMCLRDANNGNQPLNSNCK